MRGSRYRGKVLQTASAQRLQSHEAVMIKSSVFFIYYPVPSVSGMSQNENTRSGCLLNVTLAAIEVNYKSISVHVIYRSWP